MFGYYNQFGLFLPFLFHMKIKQKCNTKITANYLFLRWLLSSPTWYVSINVCLWDERTCCTFVSKNQNTRLLCALFLNNKTEKFILSLPCKAKLLGLISSLQYKIDSKCFKMTSDYAMISNWPTYDILTNFQENKIKSSFL